MVQDAKLRVLVVDDTVIYRKILSEILTDMPGVEVVGTACNGRLALSKMISVKVDLVTIDIDMPEMNGLEFLKCMKTQWPEIGAVMVSSLTRKGGEMTMKALELGAFDFIAKPQQATPEENRIFLKNSFVTLLKAFARQREVKLLLKGTSIHANFRKFDDKQSNPTESAYGIEKVRRPRRMRSEIVGIGISTGGPKALTRMLPRLPSTLNVPIVIVQHMPPVFTQTLAKYLNERCSLEVKEAVDGQKLLPNMVLIAPGGKQMKIESEKKNNRIVRIMDDPPENNCKPSVDYLFRSIAHYYPGRATGVIMTGMGSDGVAGLKLMKRTGCRIIAQDKASSVVYGMPCEAVQAGIVDIVSPLDLIAKEILRTVND
ncbi:MAG: chemotaxis response regulator protein-glutamate methylesterase [Desulfobacterales bacterium]|nr:chemotaxis response regulator protein-glutamate methylesterase [Desulfobacterales bacterium]